MSADSIDTPRRGRPRSAERGQRALDSAATCVFPIALIACGKKALTDPRTAVSLVRAALVEGAAPASCSITGTVEARVPNDLAFRVSGKVVERLVDQGVPACSGDQL